MFYRIIIFLLNLFINIFYPYRIINKENLNNIENGFILCSNHLSNIDALFFMVIHYKFKKDVIYFLAKKELFKGFIISSILKNVGAIPISRSGGDKKALENALKIIKKNKNLGVFIEGTRSKTGKFLRPRLGAAFLASSANVPILPVCITPSSKKINIFKKTLINFGKPIFLNEIDNYSIKEIKSLSNKIMGEIMILR